MAEKIHDTSDYTATNETLRTMFYSRHERLAIRSIMRSPLIRPVETFGVDMMVASLRGGLIDSFPLTVMEVAPEERLPAQAGQPQILYSLLDGGHRVVALERLWNQAGPEKKPCFESVTCVVYKPMPQALQRMLIDSMCFAFPPILVTCFYCTMFLTACAVRGAVCAGFAPVSGGSSDQHFRKGQPDGGSSAQHFRTGQRARKILRQIGKLEVACPCCFGCRAEKPEEDTPAAGG